MSPVITIDGPSGVGKSEICSKIAKNLNWNSLESGWIYRILALFVLEKKIFISKTDMFAAIKEIDFFNLTKFISLKNSLTSIKFLHKIKTEQIGNFASKLACIPYIRTMLLPQQRLFRKYPGLIANGRDMGTVVFPDACIKFFIKSSFRIRVKRRLLELKKINIIHNNNTYKKIFSIMKERDTRDYNRKLSPLLPAKNAIIVDSTYMSVQQVVNVLMNYIISCNQY